MHGRQQLRCIQAPDRPFCDLQNVPDQRRGGRNLLGPLARRHPQPHRRTRRFDPGGRAQMPPLLPQERSDRNEALPSGESALDGLWGPWAVPVTAPVSQPFTCRLGLGLGPGATASSPRPGRLGKGSQPLDEAMGPVPLLRRHRRLLGESHSAPHVASSSCPRALRRGSEASNQGSPHPTAPAALARNRRASIHADTTVAPACCPACSGAGTTGADD